MSSYAKVSKHTKAVYKKNIETLNIPKVVFCALWNLRRSVNGSEFFDLEMFYVFVRSDFQQKHEHQRAAYDTL